MAGAKAGESEALDGGGIVIGLSDYVRCLLVHDVIIA